MVVRFVIITVVLYLYLYLWYCLEFSETKAQRTIIIYTVVKYSTKDYIYIIFKYYVFVNIKMVASQINRKLNV